MSKITDEIKKVYKNWSKHSSARSDNICNYNPFYDHHWMINYLYPEVLLVAEDYMESTYKRFYPDGCIIHPGQRSKPILLKQHIESYSNLTDGLITFPCWVMPEEDVLRIMAECGIM